MTDFKVLSERDHIRKRSAMYIGAVTPTEIAGIINFQYQKKVIVPGLLKIINEIIDNSVDEFIRTNGKHADQISVSIEDAQLDGWRVTVSDNGRGIPAVKHDGHYQAELAWTRARAGSNFTDDERTTIGMNGIGSFATNCFSQEFIGQSCDGTTEVKVICSNGCANIATMTKKSSKAGTTVSFTPELGLFGLLEISNDHLNIIEDRLMNLAICYPGITFKFNGKKISVKNHTQLAKSFHEHALFAESENGNALFVIAPSGADEEFRYLTYVNGLDIKNGGSHIDYIVNSISAELIPAIKRKWKIEVLPNQIKQHLTLACWVHGFPNPRFDSQSKERLTNTPGEVKSFISFDATKLAKKIIATDAIITPMIESILHKKELAERRAASAAMKKVQKKKIANHLQATDPNPRNRTLFITEGLSAIGSLIAVRDSKRHGGYALRGKIMNTFGMKDVDILKNKELAELLAVLGLDLTSKDVTDMNYGKIAIMTDYDPDGHAIFCLLLQFFSRWPDLFKRKMIIRMNTPLYVARKKGVKNKYFYTREEYEAATLKGFDVSYIKGLGSLEKEDYKAAIDNPVETVIEYSGSEMLTMAFGDSADARKDWMTA